MNWVCHSREVHYLCTQRSTDSDIIHLQVFGFHLIVCNSKEVADDLFEKKSSIYSDRYISSGFLAIWALIAIMRFKAANAHALRVVSEAAPAYDDGR